MQSVAILIIKSAGWLVLLGKVLVAESLNVRVSEKFIALEVGLLELSKMNLIVA